jgi:hypothetical protein
MHSRCPPRNRSSPGRDGYLVTIWLIANTVGGHDPCSIPVNAWAALRSRQDLSASLLQRPPERSREHTDLTSREIALISSAAASSCGPAQPLFGTSSDVSQTVARPRPPL